MKTWLITGTSTGFGRELTEQLLARGDRVAATLRRPAALDGLAAEHGDRLWARQLDVTETARLRTVVDEAFATLGRIDVVVSNAGYGSIGAAEEFTDAQLTRDLDTNLLAPIQLARAVVPHLRAHGGGRLLQVSTMGGQFAFPGASLYHAPKWGIEGFFEAIAGEVAPFGIEVCIVEPGSARTDFAGRSLERATPLDAYEEGPIGRLRARALARTTAEIAGDPAKMAAAIIAAADGEGPLPLRLLLGSDAYKLVHAALSGRLAALESQRDLALSTDAEDFAPAANSW